MTELRDQLRNELKICTEKFVKAHEVILNNNIQI